MSSNIDSLVTAGNRTCEYTYDFVGRMDHLVYGHSVYHYDLTRNAAGRKAKPVVGIDGTTAENYTYDANGNRLTETNTLHGVKRGNFFYPHYDQVGSLRAITNSNGTVIKRIDYDSFGNVTYESNTSMTVPFGFAGGMYDYDVGLVRFGFRDYDPAIGRWTAKDPIDFAVWDGNLFGYVRNSPVNFIDSWGLSTLEFDPATGTIVARDDNGVEIGRVPAENNTDRTTRGPIAPGTY